MFHPYPLKVYIIKSIPNFFTSIGQRLCQRCEGWHLTWQGWLVATFLIGIGSVAFVLGIHPFLAPTDRLETPILIVEGWIPNYGLEESIKEFKSGHYQLMVVVGCQILSGVNVDPGDTHAHEAAKRLLWLGMRTNQIAAVPCDAVYRNRTYASAVALRNWLEQKNRSVSAVNVVTLGVHARRSRLLFEEALNGQAKVGIITITNREYDPKCWWKFSEGVKEVISEGVAFVYAKFLFQP